MEERWQFPNGSTAAFTKCEIGRINATAGDYYWQAFLLFLFVVSVAGRGAHDRQLVSPPICSAQHTARVLQTSCHREPTVRLLP